MSRKIIMKKLLYILFITFMLISCNTSKNTGATKEVVNTNSNDTISISNSELEYEIIIIEPGFNTWLVSRAKPEGFYSQNYLENKNRLYVTEWNARVLNPSRYNPNLYGMQINYQSGTDYGYDVNYKLYNYFVYFQIKYNQQLAGIVPRN